MVLGTAVIGTVILSVALTSLGNQVEASPVISDDIKAEIAEVVKEPFNHADRDRLAENLKDLPVAQQEELNEIYDTGTLRGFQGAILVGGLVALVGALLAIRLPKKRLDPDSSLETTVKQIVRNPTIARVQLEMDDLSRPPE